LRLFPQSADGGRTYAGDRASRAIPRRNPYGVVVTVDVDGVVTVVVCVVGTVTVAVAVVVAVVVAVDVVVAVCVGVVVAGAPFDTFSCTVDPLRSCPPAGACATTVSIG
jgi:hypothetical protein